MKQLLFFLVVFLSWVPNGYSCTNFPINIGALDTTLDRILVESLSVLINERTGVTVGVHYFKTWQELDTAVQEKRLEITIENTSTSLQQQDIAVSPDPQQNLEKLKELYKQKEMIWLKPFVFVAKDEKGSDVLTAPVISRKSLAQFPALPRLIAKLTKKIDDQALEKLIQDVQGSAKPKNVARDYLKELSLI